jgi:hypothetical protein
VRPPTDADLGSDKEARTGWAKSRRNSFAGWACYPLHLVLGAGEREPIDGFRYFVTALVVWVVLWAVYWMLVYLLPLPGALYLRRC